jgi:pimeloyl-ACP methyl ester carboxylesterase
MSSGVTVSEWITITLRDGATVRARVAGEGPPLLLLGNMVSWQFWYQQIPFFARHYRVIAPEFRSEPIPGVGALDALALDVPDMIYALGYERARLMGHSIGAMVLARMLDLTPDAAEAVVLANGFLWLRLFPVALHRPFRWVQPRLTPALWAIYPHMPWVARQLTAFAMVWGSRLIFLHRESGSEKRKMFFAYTDTPDGSMILRLSSALEYAHAPDLSRATMPVLVVSGGDDSWMRGWEPEQLTERLPRGEHVVFPGIGHMTPMIVPDAFNRAVLAFFERAGPRVL